MENENNDQQSNLGSNFLSQQDDNISNSKNFQISEDTPYPAKRKKVFFIILLLLFLILSAVFFVWKKQLKQDASNTKFTAKTIYEYENINDIPKEWSEKDFVLKAVKQDGHYLRYASLEIKSDKEVVLEAVKEDGHALAYAYGDLRADKEVVMEAVRQDADAIKYAYPDLRSNKEVVMEAVKRNGWTLEYLYDDLKADREVVLEAVKHDGRALEYALPKLQADREVVLEALKQDSRALEYASPELQADKEVVLEAIRQGEDYYNPLEYASKELQANKEVVLEAVKKYGYALEHASPELQADKEVVMEAIKKDAYAFQYASPELQNDKKLKMVSKFSKIDLWSLFGMLALPIIISFLISFIVFIIFTIIASFFNNIRAKILIYDFAIILIFSIAAFIIGQAGMAVMCDCFLSTFGPIINFVLGVILIPWLCYLNHSKRTEENTSKWKMLAYIGIAFGIFIIANLAITFIGEIFYVSPMSNF